MSTIIKSKNYDGEAMTLVDEKTFKPIREGDERTSSRGEVWIVTGGRAPHTINSSGKVWCRALLMDHTSEFYPSVIDAKWMHDTSLAAHAAVTTHAEAPEMIRAVNKARRTATKHVPRHFIMATRSAASVAGPATAPLKDGAKVVLFVTEAAARAHVVKLNRNKTSPNVSYAYGGLWTQHAASDAKVRL